jgi:hypothetical protein
MVATRPQPATNNARITPAARATGGDLTHMEAVMNRLELTDTESEQLREAVLTLPLGKFAPIVLAILDQLPDTDRSVAL